MLISQTVGTMKEHIINLINIVHEGVISNMDLDILNAYISSDISAEGFFAEIKDEVLSFIESIKSEKDSVQTIGSNATYNEFGIKRLLSLLYKYLDGNIYEWELEYILRVVEFEFEEEEERVENVVFNFSDPYLNYNITESNIESAIKYLTGCTKKLILQKIKDEKTRGNYQTIFENPSSLV